MKLKIVLPKSGPKPKYYTAYIGYIQKIFEAVGADISYDGKAKFNYFMMKINDIDILIDFDNFHKIVLDYEHPYFKFQCTKELLLNRPNRYSFSKISFYAWEQYYKLREAINYKADADTIICMQKPRGAAVLRRNLVQKLLVETYNDKAKVNFVNNQEIFWATINDCLVHVCVPGARNDILDRGHLQAMAFGCCTISPKIPDCLAWNQELISDVHYVICKDDYSDLLEKIEWCRENRSSCVEIGRNAKRLFEETSTPDKLVEWILLNI